MFRQMRRAKQQLSKEECIEILNEGTNGVLAVSGDGGYPYAVPLSYIYDPENEQLIFHCARTGHKLDGIAQNDKVSFCVVNQDRVVPEEFTTYFRSVIVFGRARMVEDEAGMRRALTLLGDKYSPGVFNRHSLPDAPIPPAVCIVAIQIEHMSGKEAIELVREKGRA